MAWGWFADSSRSDVHAGASRSPDLAMQLGVLPSSDEILRNAGPLGMQLGFGAVAGYCAGVALRVAGTAGLACAGVAFVAMQGAQYKGYVDVNWVRVERELGETYGDLASRATASSSEEIINELIRAAKFGVPGAGGFGLGLGYGVGGRLGKAAAIGSLWTLGPFLGATHYYQVSETFQTQVMERSPKIASMLNEKLANVSGKLGGQAGDAAWRTALRTADTLPKLTELERETHRHKKWWKQDQVLTEKLKALRLRRAELTKPRR